MKSLIVLCIMAICCLCMVFAAPADNSNLVQFVKYKNDQDFNDIQRQIIAQYDQLGGTSQFHNVKTTYVDPQHIKINL